MGGFLVSFKSREMTPCLRMVWRETRESAEASEENSILIQVGSAGGRFESRSKNWQEFVIDLGVREVLKVPPIRTFDSAVLIEGISWK